MDKQSLRYRSVVRSAVGICPKTTYMTSILEFPINGPWASKRKGLLEHSTLFLNKDLLEHSGSDAWDEEAIRARATRLHRAFVKAWPHFADIGTGRAAG